MVSPKWWNHGTIIIRAQINQRINVPRIYLRTCGGFTSVSKFASPAAPRTDPEAAVGEPIAAGEAAEAAAAAPRGRGWRRGHCPEPCDCAASTQALRALCARHRIPQYGLKAHLLARLAARGIVVP